MKKPLSSILSIGTAITAITLTDFWLFSTGVVLAQGSREENRRPPSATYCDTFARNYANRSAQGGVIGGALTGAASGALLGNAFGGRRGAGRRSAQGASTGAVAGGIAGGVRQSSERDRLYRLAFEDCMNGNLTYFD
ncbi:hypothetical protein PCC7424_2054 [Gloeothece citriformis PCC 7424]|uniref:Glycine zipper domain-containing protein n=1 Tax=Gloeothece citriformis (strain PCC 7424) TaxID=65393 RepID=B7KF26_GLOC7|nr:hypothetical protein [Gloeothece citriformis]ACK70482.1 hypothetical protein PCC7424_2054 [Gloeothece citriformis PCC 7424]